MGTWKHIWNRVITAIRITIPTIFYPKVLRCVCVYQHMFICVCVHASQSYSASAGKLLSICNKVIQKLRVFRNSVTVWHCCDISIGFYRSICLWWTAEQQKWSLESEKQCCVFYQPVGIWAAHCNQAHQYFCGQTLIFIVSHINSLSNGGQISH